MPISETYNIDCMEYMKTLPDNAFDLCVCDPPYGCGFTEGGGCKGWFSKYHQADACSQIGNVERERERENKGSRGITASEADLNATSENRTEKQRKKS